MNWIRTFNHVLSEAGDKIYITVLIIKTLEAGL